MSSQFIDGEIKLNNNYLQYEDELDNNTFLNVNQGTVKKAKDSLLILRKIQSILINCSNLTREQKLYYCHCQRYFMKLYLREFNKH